MNFRFSSLFIWFYWSWFIKLNIIFKVYKIICWKCSLFRHEEYCMVLTPFCAYKIHCIQSTFFIKCVCISYEINPLLIITSTISFEPTNKNNNTHKRSYVSFMNRDRNGEKIIHNIEIHLKTKWIYIFKARQFHFSMQHVHVLRLITYGKCAQHENPHTLRIRMKQIICLESLTFVLL